MIVCLTFVTGHVHGARAGPLDVSVPHKSRPEHPVLLSFLMQGSERVANEGTVLT